MLRTTKLTELPPAIEFAEPEPAPAHAIFRQGFLSAISNPKLGVFFVTFLPQFVMPGQPVLQRYGFSDDDAFAVGLTCGGILDIFVEPVNKTTFPELGDIYEAVERGDDLLAGFRPAAKLTASCLKPFRDAGRLSDCLLRPAQQLPRRLDLLN